MTIELIYGDCLDVDWPQVDAIITDVPYGTTACKWDVIIPFDKMWEKIRGSLKPRGAFVTTASQPFTSALVMSNPSMFKEEIIWDKIKAGNFALGNIQHLKSHENILVFAKGKAVYNPQKKQLTKENKRYLGKKSINKGDAIGVKGEIKYSNGYEPDKLLPKSIVIISRDNYKNSLHPTQKPVALYEYLIKTYTNEGDTVLDFCMGSGTTGQACINTGRNFIGIEKDEKYYNIAKERLGL